jgi:ribose transport system permease protein
VKRRDWRKRLGDNPLKGILLSERIVLYLTVVYLLILWPVVPGFGSTTNLSNVFSSMLPLLVAAIGQTFVLLTAGIDLSVTAVIAVTSVTGASIMSSDGGLLAGSPWAVPVGILAMLAVGAGMGLLNGIAVARFGMPPFMVTLAAMMFFSGFAVWSTESTNIYNLPGAFTFIAQESFFFVPFSLLVVLTVVVIAGAVLDRTMLGRWLYAVGHSPATSRVSGVPVEETIISAYVASGVCAAIASLLLTARLETGSPVLADKMLLDIVAAAVIGGTSLFGGKGKVFWTVYGALFITLIDNSLNMMGLSYFSILTVKGAVILFAAFVDVHRSGAAERLLPGPRQSEGEGSAR